MSDWVSEVVPLVRGLINDIDASTYDSDRLEELAVLSAHLINKEMDFENAYTVTISSLSISPDPSTDVNFINMTALKAAVLILMGEVKEASAQSVSVTDGPSRIELGKIYEGKKKLLDYLQEMYDNARTQIAVGNGGRVILTPFTSQYVNIGTQFS